MYRNSLEIKQNKKILVAKNNFRIFYSNLFSLVLVDLANCMEISVQFAAFCSRA